METKSNLVDASGNAMPIIGAVDIPITVSPHLPTVRQQFYVLDSLSNSNVLLRRDIMQKFWTVSFNFNWRIVRLGTQLISYLRINSRQRVKLCENTVIKTRSEQVISVGTTILWFWTYPTKPSWTIHVKGSSHCKCRPNFPDHNNERAWKKYCFKQQDISWFSSSQLNFYCVGRPKQSIYLMMRKTISRLCLRNRIESLQLIPRGHP